MKRKVDDILIPYVDGVVYYNRDHAKGYLGQFIKHHNVSTKKLSQIYPRREEWNSRLTHADIDLFTRS